VLKYIRSPWAALLVALCSLAPVLGAPDGKDDLKKLQGNWACVAVESEDGVQKDHSFSVTFEGNVLRLHYAERPGEKPVTVARMTFRLRPDVGPKAIDITYVLDDPNAPRTIKAIYELKGNTLKVCWSGEEDGRPTSFRPKGWQLVMVLKRIPA
jgi:uncharacterized protein (TIGR03067 family)